MIAFQTNILALTRGEAAKPASTAGLAVVAKKSGNLAARSANAAKETTILMKLY